MALDAVIEAQCAKVRADKAASEAVVEKLLDDIATEFAVRALRQAAKLKLPGLPDIAEVAMSIDIPRPGAYYSTRLYRDQDVTLEFRGGSVELNVKLPPKLYAKLNKRVEAADKEANRLKHMSTDPDRRRKHRGAALRELLEGDNDATMKILEIVEALAKKG